MRIAYLEPFFSGSHKSWIQGYAKHSAHTIDILSLPPHHWKWRMQAGAIALADELNKLEHQPDVILASDMLNVPLFIALTRSCPTTTPVNIYFHENQLTYPWSELDRNRHSNIRRYGYLNYASALAADWCYFNSGFHRDSFLAAVGKLSKEYPDSRELVSAERIAPKCSVLPVGIDFSSLAAGKPAAHTLWPDIKAPILLWNHRWDYDKNPAGFFTFCHKLAQAGQDFYLIVCGEELDVPNPIFEKARQQFSDRILHWGYAHSRQDYASLLWRADCIPVSSKQEFFGVSVAEAIHCGCFPLLPSRLAYPEVFNAKEFPQCFYRTQKEMLNGFFQYLEKRSISGGIKAWVSRYDWQALAAHYDDVLPGVATRRPNLQKSVECY